MKEIQKPKVLTIVGPTASGKTSLSITLAKELGGEVISADSRQVYKGLDLGTGKITPAEMEGIPHHLLDVADPRDTYTVADFVRDGRVAITDILSRNKLPIIAGGTFFYIDALLGKVIAPEVPPNEALRNTLEKYSTEQLFAMLEEKDSLRASQIDKFNRPRLIRALEIIDALGSVPEPKSEELYDALTLGISIPREILRENIHKRLLSRLELGMINEIRHLYQEGLSYERMEALGLEYRYIAQYLQGKITEQEMYTLIETKSSQYAKRQMTWLKGNKDIVWIEPNEIEKARATVIESLNK